MIMSIIFVLLLIVGVIFFSSSCRENYKSSKCDCQLKYIDGIEILAKDYEKYMYCHCGKSGIKYSKSDEEISKKYLIDDRNINAVEKYYE